MTREEAIADIRDNIKPVVGGISLDMAIKALEQTEWIQVSERLPEDSGEYLVSVIDGSGEDNDYKAIRVAWFAHKKDYDIKKANGESWEFMKLL